MRCTQWIQPSVMVLALACTGGARSVSAQGTTSFTYSGRLMDNGVPANGFYDLEFTLHSSETDNSPVGNPSTVVISGVSVVDGLFTTALDFGPDAFNGELRWLEVSVGSSDGTRTPLFPRPQVRSVPQSSYSQRSLMAVTAERALAAVTAERALAAVTAERALAAVTAERTLVAVSAETADEAANAQLLNGFEANAFARLGEPANFTDQAVSLTTIGNVGIGDTAPSTRLAINAPSVADGVNLWGDGPAYYLSDADKNERASLAYAQQAGHYSTDALPGDVVLRATEGRLLLQNGVFSAGLTINNNGVGIGTAAPEEKLHVAGSYLRVDGAGGELAYLGGDNFGNDVQFGSMDPNIANVALWNVASGERMNLFARNISATQMGIGRDAEANVLEVEGDASKTTAGDWLANSDRRIKRDIRPVTQALEVIGRLRPVAFRYTDEYRQAHPSIEDRVYYNVIAQQFAEVFPEAVKEGCDKLPGGDSILQVDTYPATIHAIAAVQELNEAMTQKDAKIAELERRLNQLTERVNSLALQLNGGAQ
jgi:hypothetical protein